MEELMSTEVEILSECRERGADIMALVTMRGDQLRYFAELVNAGEYAVSDAVNYLI